MGALRGSIDDKWATSEDKLAVFVGSVRSRQAVEAVGIALAAIEKAETAAASALDRTWKMLLLPRTETRVWRKLKPANPVYFFSPFPCLENSIVNVNSKVKLVAAGLVTCLALFVVGVLWFGMIGHNNTQNWQVYQSVTGKIDVIDTAGYYWKGFGTVWTYPRSLQAYYSQARKKAVRKTTRSASPSMTAVRRTSAASSKFRCPRTSPTGCCCTRTSTPTRRTFWTPCVRI